MSLFGHRKPPARRRLRPAAKSTDPIERCPDTRGLPEYEALWLLGRAGEFDLIDGTERPTYTYRQLAKNFARSRRFKVSKEAVRRFIAAVDPDLAKRRGNAWPIAVRSRKPGRSR